MPQFVAYLTIIIYDHKTFIVQATGLASFGNATQTLKLAKPTATAYLVIWLNELNMSVLPTSKVSTS